MQAARKRRLIIIITILLGVAVAATLAGFALKQNINLFYTPSQVSQGQAPVNHNFRIGGLVKQGSVKREEGSLQVSFIVTDLAKDVNITYEGVLPDLFREGQGVVALGHLNEEGVFNANQVLAKHDEKYMPPEVSEALKQANGMNK